MARLTESDWSALYLTCLAILHLANTCLAVGYLTREACTSRCSLLECWSRLVLLWLLLPRLPLAYLLNLVWTGHPHLARLRHGSRCAPPCVGHLRLLQLARLAIWCLNLSLAHLPLTWLALGNLASQALSHTAWPNLHLWLHCCRLASTHLIWRHLSRGHWPQLRWSVRGCTTWDTLNSCSGRSWL